MNSLSRLLGKHLSPDNADEDFRTDEEIAADEKAERIRHHRKNVRNGPVNERFFSAGQQRRAIARAKASYERKINRGHRAKWRNKDRMAAILLGQLQQAGVLPYATDYRPSEEQRVASAQWLAERFAPRDEAGDPVEPDDIQAWWAEVVENATTHYSELSGRLVQKARAEKQAQIDALTEASARVDAGGQFGVAQ